MLNKIDPNQILKQIVSGDRTALAQAITIIESTLASDRALADVLLKNINIKSDIKTKRIGVTGVPGVGKSSFIETLGLELIKKNHKVAVLAIDPTSPMSGGSILGDKTRMTELSRSQKAFIRPSPSRGHLGGVNLSTQESVFLCGLAGYDYVFVETVGVGQSEYEVSDIVDCLILLSLPGAGDEIQGIKKGILEVSDLFIINKCDGEFKSKAMTSKQQLLAALKIQRADKASDVFLLSSTEKSGVEEFISALDNFFVKLQNSKVFGSKREWQSKKWFRSRFERGLHNQIFENEDFQKVWSQMETEIAEKDKSPILAAQEILKKIVFKKENI